MWFLACVCPNVTRLVLEAVKCLIAEGAFVWAWEVLTLIVLQAAYQGWQCHGSHAVASVLCITSSLTVLGCVVAVLRVRLGIQQA